jgi:hypothetical protein
MTEFLLGLLAGIGVAYVYWKVRVYLIYRMVQRQMQDMQYLLNTAHQPHQLAYRRSGSARSATGRRTRHWPGAAMTLHYAKPYPHTGGCPDCRAERACNVCGNPATCVATHGAPATAPMAAVAPAMRPTAPPVGLQGRAMATAPLGSAPRACTGVSAARQGPCQKPRIYFEADSK